jgi:hypothetical protein
MVELTRSGKALIVTLFFRLLFGEYLVGMDQYRFHHVGNALTVLLIYGLIGLFATLYIIGARSGLFCLIALDAIFIGLQSVFTILTLSQIVDPGLHDPLVNGWATVLMVLFSLLTLIFALSAKRESNRSTTNPMLKSLILSFIALVIVTILIEVPAKLFTPTSGALRYFLIGALFNVIRIPALGIAIGYLYDRFNRTGAYV